MHKGIWFGLLALVLLAGTATWFLRGAPADPGSTTGAPRAVSPSRESDFPEPGRQADGRDGVASPSPDPMQGQRDGPVPSSKQPGSRLILMRDVENAANAVERAQALERLAEMEPVLAARKLLELSAFCDPEAIRAQEGLGGSLDLIEQRRQWCAGLDLSREAMKSRVEELMRVDGDLEGEAARIERMARDPYVGRRYELEERLANAAQEDRSDYFTGLLRRSRGFDDIHSLVALNMQYARDHGGRPMWRLGLDIHDSLYPQAELLHAQRVAMVLYGCRRFGGCGSGQYATMVSCTLGAFGQCGPGSSLGEHLYLTTPPADYGLARDILARL
ncbi:hypothetical protein [Wenzhouxiangella sediminis]|nr:hypothetical protein [Wenzhouxiangella sediminis]